MGIPYIPKPITWEKSAKEVIVKQEVTGGALSTLSTLFAFSAFSTLSARDADRGRDYTAKAFTYYLLKYCHPFSPSEDTSYQEGYPAG